MRALAPDPQVLLLDEPLSALDAKLRQQMQIELKAIQERTGKTFLFVTHDQEEALTMSDQIVVMNNGRVEQMGDPHTLYSRPESVFVANFIGEANLLRAKVVSADAQGTALTWNGKQVVAAASAHSAKPGDSVVMRRAPGGDPICHRRRYLQCLPRQGPAAGLQRQPHLDDDRGRRRHADQRACPSRRIRSAFRRGCVAELEAAGRNRHPRRGRGGVTVAGDTQPVPGLAELEDRVRQDLAYLCLPPANWVVPAAAVNDQRVHDVVVIGGGMCGLVASFALRSAGIRNFRIFDRAPRGLEGPWVTYARMETLRSPKQLTGPAYGMASLTFRAWFTAQFGEAAWEAFDKIPRPMWMDYLRWYRHVLDLPVENEVEVLRIVPDGEVLRLDLNGKGRTEDAVFTRRVIMATGRDGTGRPNIPDFVATSAESLLGTFVGV